VAQFYVGVFRAKKKQTNFSLRPPRFASVIYDIHSTYLAIPGYAPNKLLQH
jgi:hypothetical protein